MKPVMATVRSIGVRGRLSQYAVKRYSTRFVVDSFNCTIRMYKRYQT